MSLKKIGEAESSNSLSLVKAQISVHISVPQNQVNQVEGNEQLPSQNVINTNVVKVNNVVNIPHNDHIFEPVNQIQNNGYASVQVNQNRNNNVNTNNTNTTREFNNWRHCIYK